jgi:hypothetical protein
MIKKEIPGLQYFYVMEKMHEWTSKYTVKSLGSFRLIANKKQTVRDNNDQNYVHKSKT